MNRKTAFAFIFLGVIWGTNFLFMHMASRYISPMQIVFLRVLFGFIPLLIAACWLRVLRREHLRYLRHFVVMALLATVVYYWAFASGTSLLPSGISGVLSGCIPLFSFIVAALALRQEKITLRAALGVALGFVGVVCIAKPWAGVGEAINVSGIGYMVLGSLSVGCSFVYAKRYLAGLAIPALALTTYQIGLALVILLLITPFAGMSALSDDLSALIGLIIGLGLLGTGLAYLAYYALIEALGAVGASSVTYVPPVVALLVGYLFGGENIGVTEIAAMLCIFGGVFLLQKRR
jgi:drug/metabolite transporter (DMT)-like permease